MTFEAKRRDIYVRTFVLPHVPHRPCLDGSRKHASEVQLKTHDIIRPYPVDVGASVNQPAIPCGPVSAELLAPPFVVEAAVLTSHARP